MHPSLRRKPAKDTLEVTLVPAPDYPVWVKGRSAAVRRWLEALRFAPDAGKVAPLASEEGEVTGFVAVVASEPALWDWAGVAAALPSGGSYRFQHCRPKYSMPWEDIALAWVLHHYRFEAYKKSTVPMSHLVLPAGADIAGAERMADAIFLVRDLINLPANALGPDALASACRKVAEECKAEYHEIVGEVLLKKNYPAIHAVGKASAVPPRLIDLRWGAKNSPKLTLVGKGVCFDTGGLNLKPGDSMGLMKKDMGGAACALGLALLVMKHRLPVRLRVLIPAVENSVSGNAFRPQDVLATRKGLTVEIWNTDAEGRLILADALAEADSEKPDLLIDMATLTGASRVALGTDIPSFFTADEDLAGQVEQQSRALRDPLWRLPLWEGYEDALRSDVADLNNAPKGGYAGAITAALFLKRFVTQSPRWLHLDMMAWNLTARPGRPAGGEAQGVRALFSLLRQRYGSAQ